MRIHSVRSCLALSLAAVLSCAACTSSSGGTGSAQTPRSTPASTTASSTASTTSPPATTPSAPSSTAAPTTPASTTPARNPAWCVDGEITDGVVANPEGAAAGHNSVVLTFTNSSTRTCVLYGYPGAAALNASGHVVANATRRLTGYIGGSYAGLTNITLHPGQIASTILEGDVGSGGPSCTGGVSLVVTAPNLFHSSPLPGAPYVCDFSIHPVVAGSTGR